MIPQEIIDAVRAASPIEKVIAEYLPLRRAAGNYKCNCPFHADSNASLMVSPAKDIWKCFGCGVGGNVFKFVEAHEGITFPEAVKLLAQRAGIKIPEPELSDDERAKQRRRESLEVALTFARDTYRGCMAEKEAEEFLATRKIPQEILALYETGYAPSKYDYFLEQAHLYSHQDDCLIDAGLVGKSEHGKLYDRFRGRIVWPFHTPSGRIVGFTGRCIDGKSDAKYLNSPDTALFSKGKVLFGLWQARREIAQKDFAYLVEGQFDVMRMAAVGLGNTVCGSGTALTDDQARLLLRYTENVTLIYDADEAGLKATRRNAEVLLRAGINVRAIALPAGEDPDSYFLSASTKEVTSKLKGAKDIVSYLYDRLQVDAMDAMDKGDAIGDLCRLISLVNDSITTGHLINTLARISKTSAEDLRDAVKEHREKRPSREVAPPPAENGFFGMEELREMAAGKRVSVELTWSTEDFGERWNAQPAVLVCGRPTLYDLQELRSISDRVRTTGDIEITETLEEPQELVILREMARAGFDLTILRKENKYETERDEDGDEHRTLVSSIREMGWTEFFIEVYSGLKNVSENVRSVVLNRCAEEISYTDETTRAANMTRYARKLDVTKQSLMSIAEPYLKLRKNETRMRNNALEDEEGNAVLISMDEVPQYVMDDEVLRKQYQRYGFFPLRNNNGTRNIGYMFSDKGRGFVRVANFFIEPLIHIKDEESSKNRRIVELSVANRPGKTFMEFVSKEMLQLTQFEARMWEGGGLCFSNGSQERLRSIIYSMADRFRECVELKVLGWSNSGFFAFSNGLYHEKDGEFQFSPVDDIGLVEHEKEGYFLPAFSRIHVQRQSDDTEADRQSKFLKYDPDKHADITFAEWASLMDEVYKINDNGKWATLYAIMSAFRSDIFSFDRLFTALFFVGPTNSGKSKIAYSTRALYMPEEAPFFNLNLGTYPALSSLLERYRDVPVMLDEYNDSEIQDVIFQSLKAAVYDGEGRQKRKSADSKDIETTKVNAPIILLGQEAPQKDDGSLGNRCVICDVPLRGEWTEEEKEVFNRLKAFEAQGLHHLLFQVLAIRPKVRQYYRSAQQSCVRELTNAIRGRLSNCEALPRVLNTVSIFLAVCKIIEQHTDLKLPFCYAEFFPVAVEKVIKQVESLSNSNKVNVFFQSIGTLINSKTVLPGRDYKIEYPRDGTVTVRKAGRQKETVPIDPGRRLLYLKVSSIYPHYARMVGRDALSQTSLQKYMESTPYYIGHSNSTRFNWEEVEYKSRGSLTGNQEPQDDPINGGLMPTDERDKTSVAVIAKKTEITSCVIFDYDKLFESVEVDLAREVYKKEESEEIF
ncbi:DNA primase [Porphyromonas phage phage019b_ATCC49417]|uniref:DNA primase n=2 Tax=root TaxID=1 RepID=A0AAE9XD24_PORGN|nr:DNA primase [Porphyromonas gingivalis]WCG02161.1 DNA primase [Porphyromonas gingivalis]SJL32994.1 DNA primase [Porphyromonas gingivalis]